MTFSLILSHSLLFISILFDAFIFNTVSLITWDKYVLYVPCHSAFFFSRNFSFNFFKSLPVSISPFFFPVYFYLVFCISYIKYWRFFHVHVSTSALFRTNQNMDAILHFPRFFDRFWGNFFTCWNFWLSFDTFFFCHLERNVSYIVFIFTWLGLPKWQTVVPGQKGLVLRVAYLISLF